MKQRNLVLHTAVAAALLSLFGSVQATTTSTLTTAPVFARELLLGSTPNATALTIPAANAIKVVANVAIPANSTVYVYVKLSGASISTIPSVIPTGANTTVRQADGSGGSAAGATLTLSALSLGSSTATSNPGAVGAGVDYVVFQLNTNSDVIGVGGTIATVGVAVPLVLNNAAALLVAPITVTGSVGIGAPASRFGALAASASNYDATSASVSIATQAQGITFAAAASTNAGKIDLTSIPVATLFDASAVNTNTINLGTMTATNGATVLADGASAYTIASQVTAATTLTGTVTAPAGFFAPLGTTGQLWLQASGCTAAGGTGAASGSALAGSPSTVFTTAALAAAATSVSLVGTATPTTAIPYNICMGISKTIAASAGTPTLAGTLVHATTAVDSNETVAANLYSLGLNGSQRDVRSYIPASTVGYTSFVRVINSGVIAAPVSGQWIYENGTSGTAAVLIASHPAGGAVTLNSVQIEAALGAPSVIGNNRPRLRLTAPTTALEAQSFFLTNANGNFSDVSGAQ